MASEMKLLEDKVAIVTGGTRGIGYEIVRTYLENGAKVVLFGSKQESVDKAVNQLLDKNPGWAVSGMCPNLTNAKEVQDAIFAVKKMYGRLDILVNNAGISQSTSVYDYTPEDIDKIIDLNVKAVLYGILPAVKIMKEQGGGCILSTSSVVSICGQASGAGYPTSKAALNGLTLSLARELGRDNIRVNAVAPGVTKTDMVASLPKEMVDRISATIPLGRPGEVEDIANAFLYLASDMASYVTGEILSVDGCFRA